MKGLLTLLFSILCYTAQAQTMSITRDTTAPPLPEKKFYDTVDIKPKFKGDLGAYLMKNIKVPLNTKPPGRITAIYWIDTVGRIRNVEILENKQPRAPQTSIEKEVVRVIKAMPRWEPGLYNGKKVTVRYSLPIDMN